MREKGRLLALLGLIAVLSGAAVWLWLDARPGVDHALVATGTVEATEAQLGFLTVGRIENITVREGDWVKAGEELAYLDRTETLARKQQALAQVAAARALLQELERGFRKEEIAQAKAALAAASERLNDARRDLERARRLFEGRAVSQEAYDKAKVAFDLAKAQYEQAQEQMRILETGPRMERIEAQRARVAEAEASVSVYDAILANMTIRAPFDGVVTVRHREPGEIVPVGAAVLTLMNPDDRWVRIYIPENRIGAVTLGQPAEIKADTYPEKVYHGEVSFIASEAEFTPKTVQTVEERVRLVYAVKVRITGDPTHDLKPGMPADVRLEPVAP